MNACQVSGKSGAKDSSPFRAGAGIPARRRHQFLRTAVFQHTRIFSLIMDRNDLKNYSRDEGETQIARSVSVASESLSEALLSIPDRSLEHISIADAGGPWDDLACWYWDFYNEIERDISRRIPDDNIPPKPLRDELVYLYFKHVHPLCPIFDEFEFHAKYYLGGEELSFLQCISLLEFQAMMFCASLVGFLWLQLMVELEDMLMLE